MIFNMKWKLLAGLLLLSLVGCGRGKDVKPTVSTEIITVPTQATTESSTEITTEVTTQELTQVPSQRPTVAPTEIPTPAPNPPFVAKVEQSTFDVLYDFEFGSGNGFAVKSEEEFAGKIELLRKVFPDKHYWNHSLMDTRIPYTINDIPFYENFRVTTNPCYAHDETSDITANVYKGACDTVYEENYPSVQCKGFANLISDIMFGKDAPVKRYTNPEEMRVGDLVRLIGHIGVIIAINEDSIELLDCNSDMSTCIIRWNRQIAKSSLNSKYVWFITRYE